ncbi:gsdA [Symbiodinium natans]|uniref:GsdA protein n=1 Tax=Symbiodinium natans TaxID=878477 RepID=A0A812RSM9_9DINO|nr:gsdA [Symbiodinium natans]
MDGLRIIAFTEKDLQEKLAKHFAEQIVRYQKNNSSNCIIGISGSNGHSRRSRAREVFSALALWTEPVIDWKRVRIFLLDESGPQMVCEPNKCRHPVMFDVFSAFGLVQAHSWFLPSALRRF